MMKRIVLGLLVAVTVVISSCNAKREWDAKKVLKQEEKLLADAKLGKVDTTGVNELLIAYETYADKYPGDTIGANFLFKAADFYRYMRKPLKGIAIYEKIYKNYPKYDKRPYALFLQGFMFETEVQNAEGAKQKYNQFLKEYPNHPIAKDVELSLMQLGKTPEQLMEEIMAAQQADSLGTGSDSLLLQ